MKILFFAALLATTAPALAAQTFKAEDIYGLSLVTNPVLARDGRRVVFQRVAFDRGTDRRTGELWLAHIDEAGRIIDKRLLVGRDGGPRAASFSPDGSRVLFVAQAMGKPQLFVLPLADGLPRQLTSGEVAPLNPVWSPDGSRIAFAGRVEAKPVLIPGLPEKPKGSEAAADAKIISDLFWRTDGGGELKPGVDHLFVVDASSGAVTQLTIGDTEQMSAEDQPAWTPDGRSLVTSHAPDLINQPQESDLYLFDAMRAGAKPVRLTSRAGNEGGAAVSPDGRTLAFTGAEASGNFYAQPDLWTMPMRPGAAITKASARLDRPIIDIAWREDSGAIIALYNDAGVTRVGEIEAATGAIVVRVQQVGGTRLYLPSSGGNFSSARGTFAYTSAFTDRPAGLGIGKGGAETGAIDFNAGWAATQQPARIEEVNVKSRADGRRVQGWLAFPPGFSAARRYPMILDIHGGPNTDYGPFFSITHSLYAAAGYIVLFTNPRGSIGYGSEFANLITNAYPGQDHDDLMSAVDAVATRPYVDAKNLFIGGGSGGGVLTLWAIGKEPDKFRAAVALRPVVDWTDQVTTSDSTAFFARQWMGAMPWDKPELYFARSPFSLAGQVKTPTLLITGENDFRTPISQTEQMFGALKLRGVETTMIRLPGAGHGMGRPSQWLQSILAPIDWFNQRQKK